MRLLRFVALALVTFCVAEPESGSASDVAPKPPSMLEAQHEPDLRSALDDLFRLQDRAAAGSAVAATDQKALLQRIGKAVASLSAEEYSALAPWLTGYILSGGDPQVVERAPLSKDGEFVRAQELVHASALFMKGDRKASMEFFKGIDAGQLPARLAGRVALAQALLFQEEARQRYLKLAMAAMPGTLIEESALRRSALGHAESHQEAYFWRRLERYVRRFPRSIYAKPFWDDVTTQLVAWTKKGPKPDMTKLDVAITSLPVELRRRIYLSLARGAAKTGQAELIVFSANRLRRLSVEGSNEEKLALFHLSLYGIASETGGEALAVLNSTPRALLDPQELALQKAGIAIGEQIARPLPMTDSMSGETSETDEVKARGTKLVARSSEVMMELN